MREEYDIKNLNPRKNPYAPKIKKLYQRLRELREEKNLTQEDIAKVIGTSQSYYAQYENGRRDIPFYRIVQLSQYYNVSTDYIAELTDEKTKMW